MKAYYVNKAEVDKAYQKGLYAGISRGANGALNHILNISIKILENDFNWTEQQISDYKNKLVETVRKINDTYTESFNNNMNGE